MNCDACSNLRENAPGFIQNGVTDEICESLQDNTGFNPNLSPIHEDAEDLHDANDCLIGMMPNEVDAYDSCDWKEFMKKFINNDYNVQKGIICALAGLWKRVDLLMEAMSEGGYITIIRKRQVTVPANYFTDLQIGGVYVNPIAEATTTGLPGVKVMWGQSDADEPFYDVTVDASDMDDVLAVIAQPWISTTSANAKTVAIQGWEKRSDNLIHIDFDPYEIMPDAQAAQNMKIDFIVFGKKKIDLL